MRYPSITIGREYGSGGRVIGQQLAQQLGIPFYDREMISLTAKESGFSENIIAQVEQNKTQSLLYGLYMSSQALPMTDQIFLVQTQIIRSISEKGPCVIVGRCADYVLRDNPGCLRVFVYAPLYERTQRAQREYGIDDQNIEAFVRRQDKRRASYYSHFTQNKWGVAQNYHLCLNSTLGIEHTVKIIAHTAKGD